MRTELGTMRQCRVERVTKILVWEGSGKRGKNTNTRNREMKKKEKKERNTNFGKQKSFSEFRNLN